MELLLKNEWKNYGLFQDAVFAAIGKQESETENLLVNSWIYLFDNPKMDCWTENILIVERNKRHSTEEVGHGILISQKFLIEEVQKKNPANDSEITSVVKDLITNIAEKILKNEKLMTVSEDKFKDWLDMNGMSDVALQLHLSKSQDIKMRMK